MNLARWCGQSAGDRLVISERPLYNHAYLWPGKIKRAGWRALRPWALQALRHTGTFDVTSRGLRQLRKRGLQIGMAVDGGAATGEWTRALRRVYPNARLLCIEPRAAVQAELCALAARLGGVEIAQTLVGDNEGDVRFFENDDQSSILANSQGNAHGVERKARMTTLDTLVRERELPYPDLIKLDLQGAELLCLKGAARCLARTQAVLLEISFIPLYHSAPLLADVVTFMKERSFQCYDIFSLWHRPLDGALAFGDMLFLKEGNLLLRDSRWSKGPI